jgi:DNA-binding PadR family transcriptional regulator
LEKEELVKSEAIAQMGKPDKNIYEMTSKGEQALQACSKILKNRPIQNTVWRTILCSSVSE